MHTSSQPASSFRVTRRSYSPAFKAQLVAQCQHPGVSVAALAQAHGINANLVHRWCRESLTPVHTNGTGAPTPEVDFVALPMPSSHPVALMSEQASNIQVEISQGKTLLKVCWPVGAAPECAAWLRGVLA